MSEPTPVIETNYDTAHAIYEARRPWRYDARFHVPRQHIRLVPVFQPPTLPDGTQLTHAEVRDGRTWQAGAALRAPAVHQRALR